MRLRRRLARSIWINNAGMGHPMLKVWEPVEMVNQVVDINLKGAIWGHGRPFAASCCRGWSPVQYGRVRQQRRLRVGLSLYGTTKSGLRFLSHS